MANILEQSGAQPQKQPRYVPIFMDRAFTGIYLQRAALHDPSDVVTSRYYGGRPDALWDGSNIELTNRLTLQRRPGLSPFSTATYPTVPDRGFAFELTNGTIQVIIDTESTGSLAVSSVADSSGGNAVYTGTFPAAGSNAYAGMVFQIAGFSTTPNNGTFTVVASTTTTLTLNNPAAVSETIAATAISAGAVYYDTQSSGIKILLFAKKPGAGQSYFVAVGGVLYVGDGVDTWKYTPGNPNGTVWNFGVVGPTQPPTLVVTESGSAATQWQAATEFSTMGLIVDSTGNVEQILNLTTGTQFGTSGAGQPTWNQTTTGTTTDNTATWENLGRVVQWTPNTFYENQSAPNAAAPCAVYDSVTGCVFTNFRPGNASGTSGNSRPNFPNTVGAGIRNDGSCDWYCRGNININGGIGTWQPGATVNGGTFILEPIGPPAAAGDPWPTQAIYIQRCSVAGTTSTSNAAPAWSATLGAIGVVTNDNEINWISLGSATWNAGTTYFAWSGQASTFSAVEDSNGSLWVCIVGGTSQGSTPFVAPLVWQSSHAYVLNQTTIDSNSNTQQVTTAGTSGGSAPSWNTAKGGTTSDGGVTWTNLGSAYGTVVKESTGVQWVNVGQSASWIASQIYNRPTAGWNPPGPSDPFGGSVINDGTDIEFDVQTGVSGSSAPAWNTSPGGETIDNTAVWHNNGPFLQNSFSWSSGFQYAYSFASRLANDEFNTTPPPEQANPLGPPTGSQTGEVSTASPLAIISTGNAGAVITIGGVGSVDPAIDTIIIWRTADGGDTLFFLTEINNPAPVNGTPGTWSIQDYMPDNATTTLPGLDTFEEAPIDEENNPPPSNFLPMVYNFQRIWGAVGDTVLFSGGPDVLVGNPNSSFNPSDELPFLANVTRLVKTSQGLVTFLTDSIELIAGGPLTSSFYSVTLAPGIGLMSFNALDVYAGEIYFFSADSQFKVMSPSLNWSNLGFPLGEQFAAWDASKVYVAVQQNGVDNCIMVADGSTGWWRLNPRQVPGISQPEPIWSPFANITGGCQMVQSIETTPGIRELLVGATAAGQEILKRDLSVFTDNGTSYDAFFTMGSIMLVHPGQLALLKFLEADFSGVGYEPTISFLLDEIAGTFTPFTAPPQQDPPALYGTTMKATSYSPNRYYFAGTGSLARCRHLQIKVDFGTNAVGSELYNMTIFGRLVVEL